MRRTSFDWWMLNFPGPALPISWSKREGNGKATVSNFDLQFSTLRCLIKYKPWFMVSVQSKKGLGQQKHLAPVGWINHSSLLLYHSFFYFFLMSKPELVKLKPQTRRRRRREEYSVVWKLELAVRAPRTDIMREASAAQDIIISIRPYKQAALYLQAPAIRQWKGSEGENHRKRWSRNASHRFNLWLENG